MIDIKSITLRNFLSYGDYDTTLEFEDLKSCLIVGDRDGDPDRSNAVGKSSLVNAIL
jgi:AAA15 family ATPase/GTPase